jgi:hypothetical protein
MFLGGQVNIECIGCRLNDANKTIIPYCHLREVLKVTKCPCILCLVKSMCNKLCSKRNDAALRIYILDEKEY